VPRTGTLAIAGLSFSVSQSAPPFTDDPLHSGVSAIRALHITELRTRIDALRERFGASTFTWTDSSLVGVIVKAVHLAELREALAGAYAAANQSAPSYTDATVSAGGTLIRAVHIAELRTAVTALE
jgi:hypothetical protein